MQGTPMDNPESIPKKRKDQRPTLTFKGDEFGPEFRALINKAAERAGMSQAQFVAETLRREAQRIIKGNPSDTPEDTLAITLPALTTERLDTQDKRIAEIAEQIRLLTEMQKQSLWVRLLSSFRSRAPLAPASGLTSAA
jgi:hypothetical protein